jgi:translocator protein
MNAIVTVSIYIAIVLLLISIGGNVQQVTLNLTLPSFYPPDSVFGLVWSLLFVLFGFYLYNAPNHLQVAGLVYFTLVLLWTPLFVQTASTALGFYYLLFVVALTLLLLIVSINTSYSYWWLLLPQLIWVSFATLLAYGLFSIN